MSELPEGWVETTLGEVASFKYGKMPKKPNIVLKGYPIYSGYRYVGFYPTTNCPKESLIVVARGVGGTGDVKICKDDCHLTNLSILIDNDATKLDRKFVYYKYSLRNLKYLDSGSAQSQITISDLQSLEISYPALNEQKSIADTLSSFDGKIELLREQNKTLETLAQTIFKEWFVKFNFPDATGEMIDSELGEIPKGWRVGKLEDIVTNIRESLKAKDNIQDRKYIPIDNIPMKQLGLDSYSPIENAKSSLVGFEPGDILFGAMRCYFHRVCFSTVKGVTRTTVMILRPKKKLFFEFSLLLINQNKSVDYANQNSKGTTMPYAVWDGAFADMPITIPPEEMAIKFSNLTSPMLAKIQKNISQIEVLSKTRDALLPKLMSGIVRANT